ncbi:GFA family protein [Vibrio sp.]|nr:GFA family protein [Vibrio sp.]
MQRTISGSCVCGAVRFEVEDDFQHFYFCYCEQCRRMTGSDHASNLFTRIDNIRWIKGAELTKRYEHPTRTFSQVFCTECGSPLPYLSKSGKALIIPAGGLDSEPTRKPDAQIFCSEQTQWHIDGIEAKRFDGFPE